MGCLESGLEFIPEELEIMKKEISLPYNLSPPSKIDLLHRKYSMNGEITRNQWQTIQEGLEFQRNLPHIEEFYNQFLINDCYPLRGMVLLGMLLNFGNFIEKAKIIFEILDLQSTGTLTKKQIKSLIAEMVDISSIKIQKLVDNEESLQYLKKISLKKDLAVKSISKGFFVTKNKEITMGEFIDKFYKVRFQRILTSNGIRKLLKEIPEENI